MLTTMACAHCAKELFRPVGEEEKHIWATLGLETGICCSGCGDIKSLKKDLLFCSQDCLMCFMRTDAYFKWVAAFKNEAEQTAHKIRNKEGH